MALLSMKPLLWDCMDFTSIKPILHLFFATNLQSKTYFLSFIDEDIKLSFLAKIGQMVCIRDEIYLSVIVHGIKGVNT